MPGVQEVFTAVTWGAGGRGGRGFKVGGGGGGTGEGEGLSFCFTTFPTGWAVFTVKHTPFCRRIAIRTVITSKVTVVTSKEEGPGVGGRS